MRRTRPRTAERASTLQRVPGLMLPPTAQTATITISPGTSLGALSALWRPGLMISNADASALTELSNLGSTIGCMRIGCAGFGGTDQSTSVALAQGQVAQLQALQAQGATIVMTIGLMPNWLSRIPSQTIPNIGGNPAWACMGPANLTTWQNFLAAVVAVYRDAGIHPVYDFWNENFWVDPIADLWTLYSDSVIPIKGTDPACLVAGCSFGGPSDSTIPAFLAAAHGRGTALDRLTVHAFQNATTDGISDIGALSGALATAGYPSNTPILMPEYNIWSNFPGGIEADPARQILSDRYGPYILQALSQFESVNVAGAMLATLQDFGGGLVGGFGGQGLFTRSPFVQKKAWSVIQAQRLLYGTRCANSVPGGLGLGCISTVSGGSTRAIVWRYDESNNPVGNVTVTVTGHGSTETYVLPRYGWTTIGFAV